MTSTRREWLAGCVGAAAALAALPCLGGDPKVPTRRPRLGIVEHSYSYRFPADRKAGGKDRIDDPIAFVEYCAKLGAGGVQMALGVRDDDYCKRMRETLGVHDMFLECSVRLPRNRTQMGSFEEEMQTVGKSSQGGVVRTVLHGGRRYETFPTADRFREFTEQAFRSLNLVKDYLAVKNHHLAVENHKDCRTEELVALLEKVDSRWIGVCVDTGNSLALLEDPLETVEKLAPWAFSTHLKDMAVEEYPDGFLLSEVALGDGFLELPRIVRTLRAARPEVRFNLEMITRDPLKVPCLTPGYWATLDQVSGRSLAEALHRVRRQAANGPLPRVSGLGEAERLQIEDANVRRCLDYSRKTLEMG